jgi:thioredoxin reductase
MSRHQSDPARRASGSVLLAYQRKTGAAHRDRLPAAVYGGATHVVPDTIGIGGQAAASSRIEHSPGFPSGISGADLTQRTALQALKFGVELSSPAQVVDLDTHGEHLRVILADGTDIESRAALIATGASYCTLPLPRWNDFERAGICYAATKLEARGGSYWGNSGGSEIPLPMVPSQGPIVCGGPTNQAGP